MINTSEGGKTPPLREIVGWVCRAIAFWECDRKYNIQDNVSKIASI
ncbi:hypothetical protein [Fortiea contorta]|nr:hypothetical protein [Fortiea contorta]